MAKVLIVEDEISLKEALTSKMQAAGLEVSVAGDGVEGLAQAVIQKPDLILLDLLMPRMGGVAMLAKVRKDSDWGKKVPVIILTNLEPNDSVLKNLVETEPVYYLLKAESSLEEILNKVNEVQARSTPQSVPATQPEM